MIDHLENIQITLAAGESNPVAAGTTNSNTARHCPDCGTAGTGTYCSACGEVMGPALPPVHHYLKEFVHDLLALDSKLVRTVPALLFRPGFLTTEYLAGRRKRFFIPSRLYLLTAFLVFLVLASYLHKQFALLSSPPVIAGGHVTNFQYSFNGVKGEEGKRVAERLIALSITVSPYVILLGSTPIFALILKLLYRKKKKLYVEHLVFAFHFFAFALVVLVAGIVVDTQYGFLMGIVLFFVYLFLALKRVYADHGAGLFFRFAASGVSYFAIALIAIIVSVVAGYGVGVITGDLPDFRHSHGVIFHDTLIRTP
jgi:hypothetical protein